MAKIKIPTLYWMLLGAMACSGGLTGCYTQLYSRGYADRAAANYPQYYRAPSDQGDTLAPPDSTALAREDSLRRVDSLYASGQAGAGGNGGGGTGSVVVNNYYQESPYYRGYLIQDWNHPTLAFGIYSSRYRDYYGPYWWDDPWYRTGGRYHRGYHAIIGTMADTLRPREEAPGLTLPTNAFSPPLPIMNCARAGARIPSRNPLRNTDPTTALHPPGPVLLPAPARLRVLLPDPSPIPIPVPRIRTITRP
jgi:hypothetical protein